MKLNIDGRDLVAKTMENARTRDVIELQRQTGWKGEQLKTEVETADMLGLPITVFLTLRGAGFTPTWDEILDRPISDFKLVEDPEDEQRKLDAKAKTDPQ